LGLSRLFLLAESKFEGLTLIDFLIKYTGSTDRMAFYFVNVDVLENSSCYLISLRGAGNYRDKSGKGKKKEDIESYVYLSFKLSFF